MFKNSQPEASALDELRDTMHTPCRTALFSGWSATPEAYRRAGLLWHVEERHFSRTCAGVAVIYSRIDRPVLSKKRALPTLLGE